MVKSRYYFLSAVMVVLAITMAFLPDPKNTRERTPDQILAEINYDNRFWSTDRVARTIIQEDPLLMLVDVRTAEEYAAYHLPGAINIPLADLTNDDWIGLFDQDVKEFVFYSNGTIYANQAWMLLRRMNFNNLYVMRGGLNRWVETIMRPEVPHRSAPVTAHELYKFRKGASAFFGTGSTGASDEKPKTAPVPVIKKKKKKGAVEGGC